MKGNIKGYILEELTNLFKKVKVTKTNKMEQQVSELRAAMQELLLRLQASDVRHTTNEERITGLTDNLNQFQSTQTVVEHKDIVTVVNNGDHIQLDSYKSIPEFSGDKTQYRSWREQVVRRMDMIKNFKTHIKYEAALGIIRAKITKAASDILINNKTAYDIDAIIDRLDFSYADQRPLYVVEAEMTSIKQSNKSLQEYYDAINQALNMVITKIVMTYKGEAEQKSLVAETQQKAIRTFIMGLNSSMMRNTLYGNTPKTLAKAFAIAQTIYYDNQHLQLDANRDSRKIQPRMQQQGQPMKYNPNFIYNKMPPKAVDNVNKPQPKVFDNPVPMEVDISARFKQSTNWRQPNTQMNGPQKRDYNSSRQHLQQPQKMQKINLVGGDDEYVESTDNNEYYEEAGCISDDLISNASHGSQESEIASTFLVE